jgi:hypothetical protein
MSAFGAMVAALQGDATLAGVLTGGIWDGLAVGEISRQATPAAYDEFGELLPCALVMPESAAPAGPLPDGGRVFVMVWLYAQREYAALETARQRVYALLHRVKVGSAADGVFEVRHANDVLGAQVEALGTPMIASRFVATVWRG